MKQHAVAIDAKIQITVNRNHNLSTIEQFRHQRFNSNYNLQQFNNNSSTIQQFYNQQLNIQALQR